MQDSEIIYSIELTNEEYEIIIKLKNDYYTNLSLMSEEERIKFFRKICYEKNLNFEKEINGTVYKVNSHFNTNYDETILNKIARLLLK